MMRFNDKRTQNFLENEGFDVVDEAYVRRKGGVKKALKKVGLPCVAKISGRKIFHKKLIEGVNSEVKTYSEALNVFSNFKRKKKFSEVVFQKKILGKEFFLGFKEDKDLGSILFFGSNLDKKDISFKSCPIDKKDVSKMIKETKIGKKLSKGSIKVLHGVLMKLSGLSEKYPRISLLEICPFIISKKEGKIVDSRMISS